jgi:hypothetical protein
MAHRKNTSKRQGRHSTIIEHADQVVAFIQQLGAKVDYGRLESKPETKSKITINKDGVGIGIKITSKNGNQLFSVTGIALGVLFTKLSEHFQPEFEVTLR